ncbi:hypothetical protein N0V90_009500 [Kalmusia sp. IMI 367209]|nr:hypothetical protein N0V90_009500 [Kalmusia sp. IMI 367209]
MALSCAGTNEGGEEKQRKREQEARKIEAREREERNEHIRLRTKQVRKECERKAKEEAEKGREEWSKVIFKELHEIIPWSVKSGVHKNISGSAVEEIFKKAPPQDTVAESISTRMKVE